MNAPNIILIIMDTARRHNFSCYGYDRPTTPNIDKMGKSGIIFERAISSSPWTLPSHVSFLSGETVKQHGITQELIYEDGKFRNFNVVKRISKYLPLILKNKGYQCIGISNNPFICKAFGFNVGFDIFIDQYSSYSEFGFSDKLKIIFRNNKLRKKLRKMFEQFTRKIMICYRLNSGKGDKGAYKTVSLIKQFLSQNIITKNRPFFLFLNFFDPHLPYTPPSPFNDIINKIPFWKKYTLNQDYMKLISNKAKMSKNDFEILKSLYNGEISYLDKKICEIVDMFQEFNIINDSIFIVTSDHGENIGDHKLMDHQLCIYDTLLAVPLILYAPEYLPRGIRVKKYIMLKDLYYTIISLATGIPDEKSILNEKYNQPIIAEYEKPLMTLIQIKEKYPHINLERFDKELVALYDNGYKIIQSEKGDIELYNIENDPFEISDISLKEIKIVREMKKLLENYYLNKESLNKMKVDYENTKDIDKQLIEEKLREFGYIE